MWLALALMEVVITTGKTANVGLLFDFVNKRCRSSNTATANALFFVCDNVGQFVGLVGGGLLVQVPLGRRHTSCSGWALCAPGSP